MKTHQYIVGNKAKGESQNGCFKKTKHAKFPKNEHFLPPDTHTYVRINKLMKERTFSRIHQTAYSLLHKFRLHFHYTLTV